MKYLSYKSFGVREVGRECVTSSQLSHNYRYRTIALGRSVLMFEHCHLHNFQYITVPTLSCPLSYMLATFIYVTYIALPSPQKNIVSVFTVFCVDIFNPVMFQFLFLCTLCATKSTTDRL